MQAAQECLDAGRPVGTDAEELARTCWVTTHGLASLEVHGMLAEQRRDAFAEVVLRAPVTAHRPPG